MADPRGAASRRCRRSQLAVIKRQLNDGINHTMAEAVESEGIAQSLMFSSRDTAEAMVVFVEKREPKFTGE